MNIAHNRRTNYSMHDATPSRSALLMAAATLAVALLAYFVVVVHQGVQRGEERRRQQLAGQWPDHKSTRGQEMQVSAQRPSQLYARR